MTKELEMGMGMEISKTVLVIVWGPIGPGEGLPEALNWTGQQYAVHIYPKNIRSTILVKNGGLYYMVRNFSIEDGRRWQ